VKIIKRKNQPLRRPLAPLLTHLLRQVNFQFSLSVPEGELVPALLFRLCGRPRRGNRGGLRCLDSEHGGRSRGAA